MGFRSFVRRLNDPNSVTNGIVSTVLVTALAYVEPRKLTPGKRLAYRGAIAALSAWTVWSGLRPREADGGEADPAGPIGRAALTTGAAGAVLGLSEVSEAIDGRLHDGLVRAGARRPRLWMAGGEAVLAIAGWWAGRAGERALENSDLQYSGSDDPIDGTQRELPGDVRILLERILTVSDAHGSSELRAQLASARLLVFGDEQDEVPCAQLETDPELPRAVPGTAMFPVIGRFRALNDRTFELRVFVENGRLERLEISEAADWTPEELESWWSEGRSTDEITAWPSVESVEFLVETADGYRPLAV